ncbi:MAG: ATP-binding protein [Syntrophaceae bacterium]|nr:ATP-binding protein [Syntrophaceae bacterium]
MKEGGTLTVRTSHIESDTGDAVGISIRDTGPGISREILKQIFTPFFTTKQRGVGLGLAVCERIIRAHGGKIRVKSLPGQGTIFFIRLKTAEALPQARSMTPFAGEGHRASILRLLFPWNRGKGHLRKAAAKRKKKE